MTECVVNLVIQRLVVLMVKDARLLEGIHEEVTRIRDEMQMIQSIVKDVDIRVDKDDMNHVSKWMKQVREEAYHIEDAIDEYILHFAKQPHGQMQCFRFLEKVFHGTVNLIQRHTTDFGIKRIPKTLAYIRNQGERYGFENRERGSPSSDARSVTWHDPRISSLLIEEDEIVGINSPRDCLLKFLFEGTPQRMVISVVGMGGLGKTTLVKKVFDNEKVVVHFDFRAWITVSQAYKMEELLRSMIKQFCRGRMKSAPIEIDTMNARQLLEQLRLSLHEQRYIVVFDDLWDKDFWEHINYAFPKNDKGSRIIITTRNEEVAPSDDESSYDHVYYLPHLTSDKALELFYKRVFQGEEGDYPELHELSRQIVERCNRSPLAILAIASILSIKDKVHSEWLKFYDHFALELGNIQHNSLTKIMSLSYHDLPYNLRACFLYFGMFPSDYSINCARLTRLWIAEGFVEEKQGMTLEEVAQDYLTSLICRSLVQVENVDFVGKTRSCQVHDIIHDFILSRSKELSFCLSSIQNYSSNKSARHLSIQNDEKNHFQSSTSSQTRSILIFGVNKVPNSFLNTLFANFKLMKIMDFEGAPINYIPDEVGDLFHLKYLSLRDTRVDMLPKSIGKLLNLETLDLKRSYVFQIPVEISGLHKLQYLAAYIESYDVKHYINFRRAVQLPNGIGRLESLQKLHKVEANSADLIQELGSLRQLRKLHISSLRKENGIYLCRALKEMRHLRSLRICAISAEELLELESLSFPPSILKTLNLGGRLETLPVWIPKLTSLVRIGLTWSRLMDDPLNVLRDLPNLMSLGLYDAYRGEQLHIKGGGFQKLKVLGLRNLRELNKLIIDKDAMPCLETLRIGPSPSLNEVPSGIHHLKILSSLQFFEMPREFVVSLQPEDGPDFEKVMHIPSVVFLFTIGPYSKSYYRENYKRYNLGDSKLWEHLEVNYRH